jgi:Concanavalin A-like lectin/glucanases superfamily/Chaperone of endosialidase
MNKIQQLTLLFVILTTLFSSTIAQTTITQGLVAYYPFNGNANDVSGNNLNGIVTRATLTTDRRGNANNAYDFDFANAQWQQQNDEIFIPYNTKLDVTNITVSAWIYPRSYYWSSNPTDPSSIIINRFQHGYSNPNGEVWQLRFNQTSVSGEIIGTPDGRATSTTSLQLNVWHHIVMTYDGVQIKLFINGNLSATQPYSQPMNIVENSGISIGESNQANGYWYYTDGKIDDIGIWNRALSNTEIQQLYTENSISDSRVVLHNNAKSILITPDLIQVNSTVTGSNNTFIGENALKSNRNGNNNTAIGYYSLYANTTGKENTATGSNSLLRNTIGVQNTASGYNSLYANTTGYQNTVIGSWALVYNTTGAYNTASGNGSLFYNTSGYRNTSNGHQSLFANTTGNNNTSIGNGSGSTNTTGNNNTFLGANANSSVNNLENATAIGYGAIVNSSNKIVIGNASATTVGGYGTWTNYSDRRLKENILYTDRLGLDFIMKLKTASYNYTDDRNKRRRDGLIAQDIQKVMQELGVPFSGLIEDQDEKKTLNLSYSELVIPLINAVQELKRENEALKKAILKIDKLDAEMADLKSFLRK